MKHLIFALVGTLAFAPLAHATVFDTNSVVPATTENYWPFGDADNTLYQLWFSQSALTGTTGIVTELSHFVGNDFGKLGSAAWNVNIYLSTTSVSSAGLNADDPASNHGSNRTQVFSGWVNLTDPKLTIDIDDSFVYDGSGNLLLEYNLHEYTGVSGGYSGPTWQSVNENSDFVRVTQNLVEGNTFYPWGALRTELVTTPVPEPETYAMLGMGLFALAATRRRRRG